MNNYKVLSFKSSPIDNDEEAMLKYTRLGFFHFQYIESLDSKDSASSIIKNRGKRFRTTPTQLPGTYLYVEIADLSEKNRRISASFIYDEMSPDISILDIVQIVNFLRRCFKTDSSKCFTKFDAITFV